MGALLSSQMLLELDLATISPDVITSFRCPVDVDARYNSASDLLYRLTCATDLVGTALGSDTGTDVIDCIQRCEAVPGCAASSWSPRTYSCSFYGPDVQYRTNASFHSASLEALAGGTSGKNITISSTTRIRTRNTSTLIVKRVNTVAKVASKPVAAYTNAKVFVTNLSPKKKSDKAQVIASTTSTQQWSTFSRNATDPLTSGKFFVDKQTTVSTSINENIISITMTSQIETTVTTSRSPTDHVDKKSVTFLALGDSITWGYTKDGPTNSYRELLYDMLIGNKASAELSDENCAGHRGNDSLSHTTLADGVIHIPSEPRQSRPIGSDKTGRFAAPFVTATSLGSVPSGNFSQNSCEAEPAAQINRIRQNWVNNRSRYSETPDLILLLAGINDIVQDLSESHTLATLDKLSSFIDELTSSSRYPNAVVVLGTLTPVTIEAWKEQVATFNRHLPALVERKRDQEGKRILLVDLHSALDEACDLSDWVHPNTQGYAKMAKVFYDGVVEAWGRGWL